MTTNLVKLIHICLQKNRNFVVFSIPNSEEFTLIVEDNSTPNSSKKGFVMHPFQEDQNTPSIFIPANIEWQSHSITKEHIHTLSLLPTLPKTTNNTVNPSVSKEEYLQDLEEGINLLKTGEIQKFIYSRIKYIYKSSDLDLANFLFTLNKKHQNTFTYLIHHQKAGIWMGATPETLLDWNGGKISTMSLAGTLPNIGEKPHWTSKEIEEQAYVTNYISQAFSQNNIAHKVSKVRTIEAGPVVHLQSTITSLQVATFQVAENLVQSLHPTPAVCGIPLQKAKDVIATIEKHERKYYTGYLGMVNHEKSLQLFVNLRCMQVLSNSLALHVGGGITAASKPQKEWEETNHKARTLADLIG